MRFVPTIAHGAVDYLVGLMLIALPFMLGLQGPPRLALFGLAIAVLLYSLCTDYELGAVRYLRVRFHLLLDGIFGLVMLALPSFFDLASNVATPIYLIGLIALLLACVTKVRATGTASLDDNRGKI